MSPLKKGTPTRLESQNHTVPDEGVMTKVTKPRRINVVTEAIWSLTTVLLGLKNLTEGTRGPPKNDSTQVGILVSGMASLGMDVDCCLLYTSDAADDL